MSSKGFTLIELIVVVSIFTLIIFTATDLFISLFQQQKKILGEQELLSQISYNVEYMSRALRMARKDDSGTCIMAGKNYQKTTSSGPYSGYGIKFINHTKSDICQEFFWDSTTNMLYESKDSGASYVPLLADYVTVISFRVALSEAVDTQPRVTIFLDVKIGIGSSQVTKQVQTTISQRNLNI